MRRRSLLQREDRLSPPDESENRDDSVCMCGGKKVCLKQLVLLLFSGWFPVPPLISLFNGTELKLTNRYVRKWVNTADKHDYIWFGAKKTQQLR